MNKLFIWFIGFMLFNNLVYAIIPPCFPNATVKGLGPPKVYNLSWNASDEPVVYDLYYNFSSTAIYSGNDTKFQVIVYEGVNHFGVSAKGVFNSSVCEGDIFYVRNGVPVPVSLVCPAQHDLDNSEMICQINYTYADPDNDSVIYGYFLDGSVRVADISSQSLSVSGVSNGTHNISICGFDGFEFGCNSTLVNFVSIVAPVISGVLSDRSVVPFYGNLVPVYANVSFRVNDTLPCTAEGYYKKQGSNDKYVLSCNSLNNNFTCQANMSYLMEPGYYNLYLKVNNSYKSVNAEYANVLDVYEVLSIKSVSPVFDMSQVFDNWVISQSPIDIVNEGNVDLNRLIIRSNSISCSGASFSNIMYGEDSDLDSAFYISNGYRERINMNKADHEERWVFVENPGRVNPGRCSSIWYLELLYDR